MEFTKDELMKLINAGYTKADIDNFASSEDLLNNTLATSDAAPENAPAPADDGQGDPNEHTNDAVLVETSKWLKEMSETINKQISDLKKAYEEYNINQANNKVETAKGIESVMGEIINPPFMIDKDK